MKSALQSREERRLQSEFTHLAEVDEARRPTRERVSVDQRSKGDVEAGSTDGPGAARKTAHNGATAKRVERSHSGVDARPKRNAKTFFEKNRRAFEDAGEVTPLRLSDVKRRTTAAGEEKVQRQFHPRDAANKNVPVIRLPLDGLPEPEQGNHPFAVHANAREVTTVVLKDVEVK